MENNNTENNSLLTIIIVILIGIIVVLILRWQGVFDSMDKEPQVIEENENTNEIDLSEINEVNDDNQ